MVHCPSSCLIGYLHGTEIASRSVVSRLVLSRIVCTRLVLRLTQSTDCHLHTLPQDVSKIRGKIRGKYLMAYQDGLAFARRIVSSLLPHQRVMSISLYNTASARFLGVGNNPLASNLCRYLKSKPHVRILRRQQEDTPWLADRKLAAKVRKSVFNTGMRLTGEALSLPVQAPQQREGAGAPSLSEEESRHGMAAVHVQAPQQQQREHAGRAGRSQLECQPKSRGKAAEERANNVRPAEETKLGPVGKPMAKSMSVGSTRASMADTAVAKLRAFHARHGRFPILPDFRPLKSCAACRRRDGKDAQGACTSCVSKGCARAGLKAVSPSAGGGPGLEKAARLEASKIYSWMSDLRRRYR